MATTKFTNSVTLTDAAWFDDVDKSAYSYLTGVAGTNTITATGPISMTAYAVGLEFEFIPAITNTAATTINITGASALGARNIFSNGAACVGGELRAAIPVKIIDDGTQFHILSNAVPVPFVDTYPVVVGSADSTKKVRFEVDGLTTATTRVLTVPNADITLVGTGANTFTGLQTLAAGADIASAATVDLTAATGNSPRITGVVATSAVTMNTGQWCLVVADGAWPLTYNATTNKISGSASYTLTAGDMVLYHKDLSGIVHGFIIKADGTAVVAISAAATQAQMEADSSNAVMVTPLNIKWSPRVLKGFVNFNGTGVVAISESLNVTSIDDNGVGFYDINITTAFSTTTFTAIGSTLGSTTGNRTTITPSNLSEAKTTTSVTFNVVDLSNVLRDEQQIQVILVGDQ